VNPVTYLQSPNSRSITVGIGRMLLDDRKVPDPQRRMEIPAGGTATTVWEVTPQPSSRNELVTLEVTRDGAYLGEVAECYVRAS
jgi:hypothetical protein